MSPVWLVNVLDTAVEGKKECIQLDEHQSIFSPLWLFILLPLVCHFQPLWRTAHFPVTFKKKIKNSEVYLKSGVPLLLCVRNVYE